MRQPPNVSCHIKMTAELFYLYYFFNLEPFAVNGVRFAREVATVRFTDACAFSTFPMPQIDVCIVDNMIFWPGAEKKYLPVIVVVQMNAIGCGTVVIVNRT